MALFKNLLQKKLSLRTQWGFVFLAAAVASFCAVGTWAWWVSFDLPRPVERPHSLMWDAVSVDLRAHGADVVSGINFMDTHPVVKLGAWCLHHFGGTYGALNAGQLPFLILLIFSASLIAARFGGPMAGLIAPWITLFAPMTLGLSLHLDDLIALQALMGAAVALLVWSDVKGAHLSFLAIGPVCMAVWFSGYSNGVLFLAIFSIAAGATILAQWQGFLVGRSPNDHGKFPWLTSSAVAIALVAGLWITLPVPTDYLATEAMNPRYSSEWGLTRGGLLSYISIWRETMVGRQLAFFAFLAVALLWWKHKLKAVSPLLIWLFVPMILMALIPKRNDHYIATSVIATYPLVAVGLSAIPKRAVRMAALIVMMFVLFGGWGIWENEENEDFGALYDHMLKAPKPFLLSPVMPQPDWTELARMIDRRCGKSNRPVVFANGGGISGLDAFYLWHKNPRIPIGDVWFGPVFSSPEPCFVARMPNDHADSFTLKNTMENFRKVKKPYEPTGLENRVHHVEKIADNYEVGGVFNQWVIFTPKIPNEAAPID